jgi:hypothetical protein|tara:strand:+ start:225 stop:926 length:702 start_codon:yes stop_codon:yes gene_type:complete
MASNQQVILQAGTVPTETCFESVQQLYNTFVANTTAYVSGSYSLFNYGDTTPSVDDQDRPWIRTISGLPDKVYTWVSGQWASKHPVPAGSGIRMIWAGLLADLDTYDGGSSGTASSFSGPFWERDTEFNARFPVGVGNFTSGTSVEETGSARTGGEEKHTLIEGEMPKHTHSITEQAFSPDTDPGADTAFGTIGGGEKTHYTNEAGNNEGHNNLPPYYGVYFIKRTAREYYTV